MQEQLASTKEKTRDELQKLIGSLSTEQDLKTLELVNLSGIFKSFPDLQETVDSMLVTGRKAVPKNLRLIPEGEQAILDFYVEPPFTLGWPPTTEGPRAEPYFDDPPGSQSRYYRATAFADRVRGHINLAVAAGLNVDARYPCEDPWLFGFKSDVEATLFHEVDLLSPQTRPLNLRLTVQIALPKLLSPSEEGGDYINLTDTDSTVHYYDNISVLVPGYEHFAGLVGVTGEFCLGVAPLEGRTFKYFLSRFQCRDTKAMGEYITDFNMQAELSLPRGIQNLRIDMKAILSAYCCQEFSLPVPNGFGPIAFVDLRSYLPGFPVFNMPLGFPEWSDFAGIKIKRLHFEFFNALESRDGGGTA